MLVILACILVWASWGLTAISFTLWARPLFRHSGTVGGGTVRCWTPDLRLRSTGIEKGGRGNRCLNYRCDFESCIASRRQFEGICILHGRDLQLSCLKSRIRRHLVSPICSHLSCYLSRPSFRFFCMCCSCLWSFHILSLNILPHGVSDVHTPSVAVNTFTVFLLCSISLSISLCICCAQ